MVRIRGAGVQDLDEHVAARKGLAGEPDALGRAQRLKAFDLPRSRRGEESSSGEDLDRAPAAPGPAAAQGLDGHAVLLQRHQEGPDRARGNAVGPAADPDHGHGESLQEGAVKRRPLLSDAEELVALEARERPFPTGLAQHDLGINIGWGFTESGAGG